MRVGSGQGMCGHFLVTLKIHLPLAYLFHDNMHLATLATCQEYRNRVQNRSDFIILQNEVEKRCLIDIKNAYFTKTGIQDTLRWIRMHSVKDLLCVHGGSRG